MSTEALKQAAEFNRYFTSSNGVDVGFRVSVPRDEWRTLYTALTQATASEQGEPVADVPIHPRQGPLWANVRPRGADTPVPSYPMRPLVYADTAQPAPAARPMPDAVALEIAGRVSTCVEAIREAEAFHRIGSQPTATAVPAVPEDVPFKLEGKFTYCGQPARFLGRLHKIGDPYQYVIAWQTKGGLENVAVVSELDHDIERGQQ